MSGRGSVPLMLPRFPTSSPSKLISSPSIVKIELTPTECCRFSILSPPIGPEPNSFLLLKSHVLTSATRIYGRSVVLWRS